MAVEIEKQQVKVYKNINGGLSFSLGDITNPNVNQHINFNADEKVKRIRMRNLVTMFEIEPTFRGFEKGLFTIEKESLEKLLKFAEEESVYIDEDRIGHILGEGDNSRGPAEIKNLLKLNRISDIEKIVKDGSIHQRQILIDEAKKESDKLTTKMVSLIEEGLTIEIMGDE